MSAFSDFQRRLHQEQRVMSHEQRLLQDDSEEHRDSHLSPYKESPLQFSQKSHAYSVDIASGQSQWQPPSDEQFEALMNDPRPSRSHLHRPLPSLQSCPPFTNYSPQISDGMFPTEQFHGGHIPAGQNPIEPDIVARLAEESVVPAKRKRGPGAKKPAASKVIELEDDEGDEGVGNARWADSEVRELIAFRQEMDEEFERNAKKQGVSTWEKLQARMVVACPNFTKGPDACRKKWKYVYKQYAVDKRHLQISGEGRKVTCKFFEEIDIGFNNRLNVRKQTHGDARGSPNPCPTDDNCEHVAEEGQGISSGAGSSAGPTDKKEDSPPGKSSAKKMNGGIVTGLFGDMAMATTKISSDIGRTADCLEGIRLDMKLIIDKL